MDITDITKKLIGKINPQGETNIDVERFENLKQMCGLVNNLIIEIEHVSQLKHRQEHSIKKSAEYASEFLTNVIGIKD